MFLELLRKEFIERKNDEKQSIAMLVLSVLLRVLLIAGFIALECFIALNLDKKIVKYSSYGSFDFLVLFLFAFTPHSMAEFARQSQRPPPEGRRTAACLLPGCRGTLARIRRIRPRTPGRRSRTAR